MDSRLVKAKAKQDAGGTSICILSVDKAGKTLFIPFVGGRLSAPGEYI